MLYFIIASIVKWRGVAFGFYPIAFGIGAFYGAYHYGRKNPGTEEQIRPTIVTARIFVLYVLGTMFLGCGIYVVITEGFMKL
jgi:hypothetical protein